MKLKTELGDFLVDEILDESLVNDAPTNYHLYLLKKTNYTTERAVTQVAKSLKISRKSISYAGTKDKNAITTQYVVIRGRGKEQVEALDLKDIKLEFKGYTRAHLTLGDLSGNRFTIIVRGISIGLGPGPSSFIVPNYFDDQRFSTNNVEIGMALLKKDFKKAAGLLEGDIDADAVSDWLEERPTDFVGALLRMPKKILLFYVHSVQSKLFNEFLKKRIVGDVKKISMNGCSPLIGSTCSTFNKPIFLGHQKMQIELDILNLDVCDLHFFSVKEVEYSQGILLFPKELLVDEHLLERKDLLVGFDSDIELDEFGLNTLDFIIKQIPSLTLEGAERPSFFKVKDCKVEDFVNGVQKISFVLGKGSYATIVVKQLFN